ncbi:hypothetical protein HW932_01950 [Allochromatium humboldtianum]|uniref:Uncharacterized protein n=1 Tax=Allochromatium humboldtianum TaxID=504901 RepID=A0A850R9R8_9GAMM|nr:hypothetical protein [Allochromatium humboldtianum]NVZ08022.1 hypothetical protein [Allochromatium humboldtianum]
MLFYCYSRSDGSFQGSGVTEIQNAEVGSTTMMYDGDADTPRYFDGDRWGDTPTPHGPPAAVLPPLPVPDKVSRFQARAALHMHGLLASVEALMADPETDPIARIAWQDAQEFRRHSPTVEAISTLLELTAEQIDTLFVTAGYIEA